MEEREEISRGIVAEESGREIARRLGRHFSVINREIARNSGRSAYRASEAQQNAIVSARRPKDRKVEADPLLLAEVNKGLALKWSPQQISARLKIDFPGNEEIRVSASVTCGQCSPNTFATTTADDPTAPAIFTHPNQTTPPQTSPTNTSSADRSWVA